MSGIARALIVLLLLSCGNDRATAQQKAPASAPAPAAVSVQPSLPVSLEQALYLIRSTLLSLNDANRTGNYTVLRDLAAPDFQARNTAADLGLNFLDLRRRNFDLYGAGLLAPQFIDTPALDQRGLLRLAGYIPTQPQQIKFDLTFQVVAGQWRLFAVAIATPEAASVQAQATPVKPAATAQKRPQ
ncbi:hypothetical protein ACK28Q_43265 [Bradyrhizobium japonicum]|uniref:hypothetical protein n=1 Tax=Bradyrhizobium TaxID=374 RepID=UPI0002EA9E74|nr:hypothetical protein [Bradyrhizobium japonicum]MBR0761736.1 hypothetical protein [Bradyrhizobium japonicum]MCS3535710.1 hypothetical protein [Bradyrhizobium japonicum]MCS3988189.1 hypothetical protein [Bradyrhizobium japonicum]MCS4016993.1 hypothetical protein [Bradyrhizobium japonicum]MCS4204089.1 hypothetical protein [Bradyrhizobium japonicum]